MNQIILETLRNFDISLHEPIHKRDLDLGEPLSPKAGNLVKVVTGMRRSGKSYRLFQEMKRLNANGVPWSRICYFNFEDERLSPVATQIGDDVLEAFEALNPGAFEDGVYLFFDELQEMDGWGKWMRRIVDTRKVTVYATGSSSKMLSTEITTGFRGRAIDFELLPLSFAESLRYNGLALSGQSLVALSTVERIRINEAFSSYLKVGGFPAVQQLAPQVYVPILQSYAQQVVARDVVERHRVAKPRVASIFAQRLLSTNAKKLSIRKMVNDLKAVGISTSRELLGDILAHFTDAYLAFTIKERTYSLAESSNAPSKVYAVDPGLALANGRANTNDMGQRLECAVYLELRRRMQGARKGTITSLRTKAHGYEIDFALGDALDNCGLELMQVCQNVDSDSTLNRELRALWEALDENRDSTATLIVAEGVDAEYKQGDCAIKQIPAWKWFLNM